MKKIISLILFVTTLLMCLVTPIMADTIEAQNINAMNKYSEALSQLKDSENVSNEYKRIIPILENFLELGSNEAFGEALLALPDEYKKVVIEYHHSLVDDERYNATYFFSSEIIEDPQIVEIDNLAQEYYTYYQQYGVFPPMSRNSTYVDILSGLGYYFTTEQVSQQLVTIGFLAQLDGPFMFLDLLCIIAGAAVITECAIDYYYNATAINDSIAVSYGSAISVYTSAAETSTRDVVVARTNGIEYWRAILADYRGLGGIAITTPLTFTEAIFVMQENDLVQTNASLIRNNVYSLVRDDAETLAQETYNTTVISHPAHEKNGRKPLNLPHFHAVTPTSEHGRAHSFYTY